MEIYYNLNFHETCDVINTRKAHISAEFVAQHGELAFDLPSVNDSQQDSRLRLRLLGQPLEMSAALHKTLLRDFGLQRFARTLPADELVALGTHLLDYRLQSEGGVTVWHNGRGRLLHLAWAPQQQPQVDGVEVFRGAFQEIKMKNQHTVRNPRVLVMKDAATHVEVTADCEKVREPHLYDTLMGGITLRHSEMQAMPTTLAASIYRGFCKNQYLSGFHKSDSRYQGDIPVPAIWYKQSSNIASVLGSLLNRMDRLSRQPCVATEMAIALLSSRWNFAPETTTVLYEIANDKYLRSYRFQGDESLYDVLNTITAVTTHRRHRTNRRDCRILGQLSDALLTQHSPLQRLLCTDLQAPVERHFEISEYTGELDDIEIDDWYDDFLPGR